MYISLIFASNCRASKCEPSGAKPAMTVQIEL
uniref:Uncharacterized protein n=1 Tax=Rhizophora mucronata TaxID=61149 RepID=A0A2P2L5H2_RHIMU